MTQTNPQAPQQALSQDWRATLPRDWTVVIRGEDGQEMEIPLKDHPALAKYASKDEAVKALVHAQKLIGRRPDGWPEGWVEVPGPEAGVEAWEAIYAALGRPEGPEGYELPDLELPEGFEISQEIRSMYLEKAHELGLTTEQVRGLYQWFLPLNMAASAELADRARMGRQGELETLRSLHRGETGQVLDAARQAVLALGGEDLLAALDETGAGDRAAVVNAFARVAPLLMEGRLRNRGPAGVEPLTEARLKEMMRDPRYFDPTRRDPDFVRQVTEGFERLHPGAYEPGARV